MRLAILEPNSLVGKELRELLRERGEGRFDLDLLTVAVDEFGTLAEVDDEATVVSGLTAEAARSADAVVLCGTSSEQRRALAMLPEDGPVVVVAAADLDHPEGDLHVAGLAAEQPAQGATLVSPHPAVIALAHLLEPLVGLGLRRAVATVLLPASSRGAAGLDELFGQTRALLNFESDRPTAVFGYQLAFNLLPGPSSDVVRRQVATVLGADPDLTVQLLQSSVFHGVALSLLVDLDEEVDQAELGRALSAGPFVDAFQPGEGLGPIDAAQREEILLGRIRADPGRPGSYWLWAVMDNLRRGGASNLLAILEALAALRNVN